MPNLHELNCSVNEKNTAFGSCFVDWKLIRGAFLFDYAKVFSTAELAQFGSTMRNLAKSDTKSLRCYPIHNFVNPTDNTEAETVQTFADGSKAFVRDGVYDWTFQFTQGGYELLKALRSHNGQPWVLFYDQEGKVLGFNNNGSFAAIPLQIFLAKAWKMNTGSQAAAYEIRFVFNTNYALEDSDFIKSDVLLPTVIGLKDIIVQVNSFNIATGLVNVTFREQIGGSNLFPLYSPDFNTITVLAVNEQTQGPITITSITADPNTDTWNIQLLHASPNYPTSGYIDLKGAYPSTLALQGLSGYEIIPARLSVATS